MAAVAHALWLHLRVFYQRHTVDNQRYGVSALSCKRGGEPNNNSIGTSTTAC